MSDENHAPLYPDVDMKKLGERIKQIRESTLCAPKSGSSITYMSGKEFGIAVGISDSSAQTIISDMENGKKASPNIATLLNIAHIGGKSLEWLLYGDNAPAPIKRDAPDTSQTPNETPVQNDRTFDVNDLFRAIADTADTLHTIIDFVYRTNAENTWPSDSDFHLSDCYGLVAFPLFTACERDYRDGQCDASSPAATFALTFMREFCALLSSHKQYPRQDFRNDVANILAKIPHGAISGQWPHNAPYASFGASGYIPFTTPDLPSPAYTPLFQFGAEVSDEDIPF